MTPADLARNPLNSQLPGHLSQIGSNEGERSILILDNRDNRVQRSFSRVADRRGLDQRVVLCQREV